MKLSAAGLVAWHSVGFSRGRIFAQRKSCHVYPTHLAFGHFDHRKQSLPPAFLFRTSHSDTMMGKKGLLERLAEGPVIGDGSYVFTLEKRGYVKGGPWTPEAVIEHPEGVKQLHREFMRAGADVLQAFTFYSTDDKLHLAGNLAGESVTCHDQNEAACKLVQEVAAEGKDVLICGGCSPTPSYMEKKGKEVVQQEFKKQVDVFAHREEVDFLLCEFMGHVEECEWAIEAMKAAGKPVACTMRIGPKGDQNGVPTGECAVRMAKAGADVVGINCLYDVNTSLKTVEMMKTALDKAGLSPYLMIQPLGYHCPEVENMLEGYFHLPEAPFALEPRLLTRFDVQKFARAAYELGVRYLGGCCGFEPYHIRALAEELAPERGRLPDASAKHEPWGGALKGSMFAFMRKRAGREHWENLKPTLGRPDHSVLQDHLDE
ncbi:betaine--homocysteine S-methyltransferase 1-like isoform X1 [Branchiostoma floridae x Branchiostoma japonicum]